MFRYTIGQNLVQIGKSPTDLSREQAQNAQNPYFEGPNDLEDEGQGHS